MSAELYPEIVRLEGELLTAWVKRPLWRAAWTPNPEQMATVHTRAVASAFGGFKNATAFGGQRYRHRGCSCR